MDDSNPFTRLGLQKELVESLHRQGRLNDFLRTYYRSIQTHVHPDRGGDSALSATINAAYNAIQQKQSNIESWIRSMSNGDNPEHLAIIEGLAAKVEEYQGMENDYRILQQQYAELLISRNSGGMKADVRKAAPRARREEESFTDDFEESIGRDFGFTPEVKRPRARRVDADAAPTRKEAAKGRTASKIEPIVLTDLISYGMDGKPAAKYTAYLDGEAVCKADGSYLIETQRGFEKYFASKKDGRRLPDARELYAVIERLHDTKNPALGGIVSDMESSWLCTGTGIDYKKNIIVHPGFGSTECIFPAGSHWLDEVVDDNNWKKVLQAVFGPKDVERVPEILQAVSRKRPYIWTPDASGRKSLPERAVWLNISTDRFDLCCDFNPIIGDGRVRGVRVESA